MTVFAIATNGIIFRSQFLERGPFLPLFLALQSADSIVPKLSLLSEYLEPVSALQKTLHQVGLKSLLLLILEFVLAVLRSKTDCSLKLHYRNF